MTLNNVCAALTGTLLSISTERANDYDDSQKDQEKDQITTVFFF